MSETTTEPTREPDADAADGAVIADDPADDAESAAAAEGDEGDEDELKRKFREALERKRQTQADRNAKGGGKGSSKIHGTHGAAGGKRSFRRKSGG
ncbi:hypothetical protein Aph01nite_48170 [Acrocarpospora phusangensis]|uniref:DUF5302 domain-containing protein n=1 Tax=Acrocarpospora phusangensis TaxID=1070424 RepID=A0A919UQ64_9ACTN|nr:DUF5302 domain-containing protein [Acrocarpospora phusangensis]GIH26507.1 hypothetical protein Aph01nite_48170 [Acrocarpospora phusangensis]